MKTLKKYLSIILSTLMIITSFSVVMPIIAEAIETIESNMVIDEPIQEKMTSKILNEVPTLREEYAKHFQCEDGSFIAVTYSEPIHYIENGQWKEIDNSLKLVNSSGKNVYTTESTSIDVKIPQNFANGQKVSAKNKGYTISFGVTQQEKINLTKTAELIADFNNLPSNANEKQMTLNKKVETLSNSTVSAENSINAYNNEIMSVKTQTGAVVFEGIFENADLEYIVTTNSIKENIVVNKKQDKYVYSFDMHLGGLIPIVNEDNSIRLVSPENIDETIFYIAAPYMYDANNQESSDINMSFVCEGDTYTLTLEASASWINSSKRAFPIVIDPTVYLSFDDVYVLNGPIDKNDTHINNELRVGKNLTNLARTYMKPNLPTNIPKNSHISDAYIVLKKNNYYQAPFQDDISILAYDCFDVDSWNPTNITWENQPFTNTENGYKIGHSIMYEEEASSDKTIYSFNIFYAVKRWFSHNENYGIMFASSDETSKTQIDFHSSRATNPNNHPTVYISYLPPSVSISSWNTDSKAKESDSFTVTTGGIWTTHSNSNWLSLSKTAGIGTYTSKIIVSENTSVEPRTGTITVTVDNDVIGTITVTQYGAEPYITVNQSLLEYSIAGDKKTVNLYSNTAWSVGELPSWLCVTPSSGIGNAVVEIEAAENYNTIQRISNIIFASDTNTTTINITQTYDSEQPPAPNIYAEDGVVYITSNNFDLNLETESPEHIEYKIGNGDWIDFENEPLYIMCTYDVPIYARTYDEAGNLSETVSVTVASTLGEYTAFYTDIVFGEGVLPIGFERIYSSKNGWFFSFEANITEYTNGYVFTDFYGNKQHYIINEDGKYMSSYGAELKIENGAILETNYLYFLTYNGLECYFDKNGKLAIVKDNYNTATYSWSNNSICITDIANNTNIVTLSDGNPISIITSRFDTESNSTLSKNVQYQWTDNNLTAFIDAANITHNYFYTNGLLTDNDGETVAYSEEGRVKKITQPNGAFVKYTYNDIATNTDNPRFVGNVTVSDSKGITENIYYADGFVVSNGLYDYSDKAMYTPTNISGVITSDIISQEAYIINSVKGDITETEEYVENPPYIEDVEGNYTFYSYDNDNNVTSTLLVKSGSLIVTEETTFAQAEAVAETKSTFLYDINGNIIEQIYQKRVDTILLNQDKITYLYNDNDSIVIFTCYQWINGEWYQTNNKNYTYNLYGLPTSQSTTVYTNTENEQTGLIETSSKNVSVTYEYDTWGQQSKVITIKDETDISICETTYDVLGKIISISEDGKKISYTYDNKGNVLTVTKNEEVTAYTYADNGNLVSRINPTGTVANYNYDVYGNLTYHSFNGYTFTYNTLGNILTLSSENRELVNYVYSENIEQNILTSNFANGQIIVYDYNEDNEISEIKLGTETKYGYEYFESVDENGEITEEWTELTDYVTDIKKVIEENKITVNDINGNFIYSIENVYTNEEDVNSFYGNVITISENVYTLVTKEKKDIFQINGVNSFAKEYTYTKGDLSKSKIEDITTLYKYNADKNISVFEYELNNFSEVYSYTYDKYGNITTENVTTKNGNGTVQSSETIDYTYDNNEQLINVENSSFKYKYTYDNRGNILNSEEFLVSVDENGEKIYTLIEENSDVYTYDTIWKDKLIGYNGKQITYDTVGNPTNYMGNILAWTMGRQLASFGNINYTYNESGIRTSKTSNGITTNFYLDGTNIIEQTDGITTLHFFYDSNGEVVGLRYNGINYIYVKNTQSDIVGIADINGNLLVTYSYDPWGAIISITGTNVSLGELNPFRYRSYYYDSDIGMYYLQSRYYDPAIRRFINSDDVNYIDYNGSLSSYNTFEYCCNNPINYSDYSGNSKKNALNGLINKQFDGSKSYLETFAELIVNNGKNTYTAFHELAQIIVACVLIQYGYSVTLEKSCSDSSHEMDVFATKNGIQYMWEIKPNTNSGIRAAEKQLSMYSKLNPEIKRGFYLDTIKVNICENLNMIIQSYSNGILLYHFETDNGDYLSNSNVKSKIQKAITYGGIAIATVVSAIIAIVIALTKGKATQPIIEATAVLPKEQIIIIFLPQIIAQVVK